MFKNRTITGTIFTMLTLAGIALVSGCGGLQAPVAPGQAASAQKMSEGGSSSDSPEYVVFFSRSSDPSKARVRAAKPTAAKGSSGKFSPRRDGRLEVGFDDRNNGGLVQKATFEVKKGSIDREVEISMTVYSGSALEDIGVKLTPSGLKFHPSATLKIDLQGVDRKDLQGLKVYHIEGSKVTEISVKVTGNKNNLTLTLEIPGFSEYSLGDDWRPPEGEGP